MDQHAHANDMTWTMGIQQMFGRKCKVRTHAIHATRVVLGTILFIYNTYACFPWGVPMVGGVQTRFARLRQPSDSKIAHTTGQLMQTGKSRTYMGVTPRPVV